MTSRFILAALALVLGAAPGLAMGGNGDGGGRGADQTIKKCKTHEIYDNRTKKCIKVSDGHGEPTKPVLYSAALWA